MNLTGPTYIGDGVYAEYDGFNVWLKTSDGIRTTNTIALEPAVVGAFLVYLKEVNAYIEQCLAPTKSDDTPTEG